jgi:hypothetical protein
LALAIQQQVDYTTKQDNNLLSIESIVKSKLKSSRFDKQWQWLITLFVDEDALLLSSVLIVAQILSGIHDHQAIQELMAAFFEAIHHDVNVLIDWLCSDDETATLLLRLLMYCLKIDEVTYTDDVKRTLSELNNKISSLTSKGLFPYNVNPLIKLLTKVE